MLRAYLLSYDIADPKRLRYMHKIAKAYGKPLQFSVFACMLRREDRVTLASRVESIIDQKRDRVIILDIGPIADRESWIPPMEVFGCQEMSKRPSTVIV